MTEGMRNEKIYSFGCLLWIEGFEKASRLRVDAGLWKSEES